MIVQTISELAVFGGQPAFREKLHVGRPNVGDKQRLLERIEDILDRNWLTNDGPYSQALALRIAELVDVKHCIPMCNGTIALEIAIRAAGLAGEVIVPSFTFVATAHSLQWQEIKPVFCDIDPRTHTIDPEQVEALITPKTTGIIGVHLWGRPCDIEALQAIADRHGLQLLFDASHAFTCTHGNKPIGGFGRAEIFSFHATKFCNSFEGGAVVTNDDELARKINLMRNFGFSGKDNVSYIGSNGKMIEVAAAMGLTSIESHEDFIATNKRNHAVYRERLARMPGVRFLEYDERERNNYHYVILEITAQTAGISRDDVVLVLEAENVLARRYFYPGVHAMEPYRSFQPQASLVLPETERLVKRVMALPTGTAIDVDTINKICDIIELACTHGRELTQALRERVKPV